MTPVFSGRAKLVISLAKYGFAPRCAVFDVLSLSLNKESTKESQPRRSPWELPFRAALQSEKGERHKKSFFNSRHIANTSGRYAQAKSFAGFLRALGP
jgi:hypothetical protein